MELVAAKTILNPHITASKSVHNNDYNASFKINIAPKQTCETGTLTIHHDGGKTIMITGSHCGNNPFDFSSPGSHTDIDLSFEF